MKRKQLSEQAAKARKIVEQAYTNFEASGRRQGLPEFLPKELSEFERELVRRAFACGRFSYTEDTIRADKFEEMGLV